MAYMHAYVSDGLARCAHVTLWKSNSATILYGTGFTWSILQSKEQGMAAL